MHFPQNTDIKTSSNIFIFIQSRMIVKIIVKTLGNSLKIRVEYYPPSQNHILYVDIIGYQLFAVNTVEKWMCFLLAYGRKPRFNVFNLILQKKCEFEVAK